MSDNNLPSNKVRSNNVFKRIRNGFAAILAAIGIITPSAKAADNTQEIIQDDTKAPSSNQTQDISQDERYDEILSGLGVEEVSSTDKFKESLQGSIVDKNISDKVVDKVIEDKIVDKEFIQGDIQDSEITKEALLELLATKNFGEEETEVILNTWDALEKNYEKNNKQLNYQLSKNDMKKRVLEVLDTVKKIELTKVYSPGDQRNDKNAEGLIENKAGGTYSPLLRNILIGKDMVSGIDNPNVERILMHEIGHVINTNGNSVDINMPKGEVIFNAINEGNSDYWADMIKKNFESEAGYYFERGLYSKLVYLLGDSNMQELVASNSDKSLLEMFNLDVMPRYGEELTKDFMYKMVNSTRLYTRYTGEVDIEKEIETVNSNINIYMNFKAKYPTPGLYENPEYSQIIQMSKENNGIEIKNIRPDGTIEGYNYSFDTTFEIPKEITVSAEDIEYNKFMYDSNINYFGSLDRNIIELFQQFEGSMSNIIRSDISKVSSKQEALQLIERIDAYTNRSPDALLEEKDTVINELYSKCNESGALNIQSKEVFKLLFDADLYDIANAKVNIQGNKITIVDGQVELAYEVNDKIPQLVNKKDLEGELDVTKYKNFVNVINQDIPVREQQNNARGDVDVIR